MLIEASIGTAAADSLVVFVRTTSATGHARGPPVVVVRREAAVAPADLTRDAAVTRQRGVERGRSGEAHRRGDVAQLLPRVTVCLLLLLLHRDRVGVLFDAPLSQREHERGNGEDEAEDEADEGEHGQQDEEGERLAGGRR